MDNRKKCFLCGRNGAADPLEEHHIFNGANRNNSTKYGLTVYLCGDRCHRNGEFSAHKNINVRRNLQRYGQRKAMEENNWTTDDFIKIFGRNYI